MPRGVYDRTRSDAIPETGDVIAAEAMHSPSVAPKAYHTGIVRADVQIAVRSQVLHYRAGQTIHAEPDVKALASDAGADIDWQD